MTTLMILYWLYWLDTVCGSSTRSYNSPVLVSRKSMVSPSIPETTTPPFTYYEHTPVRTSPVKVMEYRSPRVVQKERSPLVSAGSAFGNDETKFVQPYSRRYFREETGNQGSLRDSQVIVQGNVECVAKTGARDGLDASPCLPASVMGKELQQTGAARSWGWWMWPGSWFSTSPGTDPSVPPPHAQSQSQSMPSPNPSPVASPSPVREEEEDLLDDKHWHFVEIDPHVPPSPSQNSGAKDQRRVKYHDLSEVTRLLQGELDGITRSITGGSHQVGNEGYLGYLFRSRTSNPPPSTAGSWRALLSLLLDPSPSKSMPSLARNAFDMFATPEMRIARWFLERALEASQGSSDVDAGAKALPWLSAAQDFLGRVGSFTSQPVTIQERLHRLLMDVHVLASQIEESVLYVLPAQGHGTSMSQSTPNLNAMPDHPSYTPLPTQTKAYMHSIEIFGDPAYRSLFRRYPDLQALVSSIIDDIEKMDLSISAMREQMAPRPPESGPGIGIYILMAYLSRRSTLTSHLKELIQKVQYLQTSITS